MEIRKISVSKLLPADYNPRKDLRPGDPEFEKLKRSIEEFGYKNSFTIPIETGVFSDIAPDRYMVVVPLADTFALHADNQPNGETQEARISIYTQGSYTSAKNAVVRALLNAEFTITDRQYIGYETETGYHHYNVDVAKWYVWQEPD